MTATTEPIHLDILKDLQIASPCTAAWEDMAGDHRVRRCGACNLGVHNISRFTRAEVQALIERTEGRFCARLYRRADGTVLTADCPVGLAAVRARTKRALAHTVLFVAAALSAGLVLTQSASRGHGQGMLGRLQPFKWANDLLATPQPMPLMGDICIPNPPSPPAARITGASTLEQGAP
ncbi:MAG: hypothetical protein JNK53_05865 [Phycisphaerae bacterium]|nr:hypothetical protein [Phycisphaerae bacterium]